MAALQYNTLTSILNTSLSPPHFTLSFTFLPSFLSIPSIYMYIITIMYYIIIYKDTNESTTPSHVTLDNGVTVTWHKHLSDVPKGILE